VNSHLVSAGFLRWITSVVVMGLAVTALLALVARFAGGHGSWSVKRPEPTLVPAAFSSNSVALFAAIDAYVTREMHAVRAPGVGLVIVRGDRMQYARGFGVANPTGRPVTPQTPFILGSLTKSFTALAVMQLVDASRIELDTTVQRYLPWFRVRDARASARITVRHLLNHTSGIPTSAGMLLVRGSRAATTAEQADLIRRVRLSDEPGRTFVYSNANYWLLGLIIESVTRGSYEAYVTERILAPLDMRDSFTSERDAQAHGLAQGYRVWFGFPRAEDLPFYARELSVGYLISSPEDMGKYLEAHLNGGRYRGAAIISDSGLAALHTPPAGKPYAMGWLADTIAGKPILWHTGAVANYHTDMLLIPDAHVGAAIFANVNNFLLETQFSETIKGVGALLLGFEPPARRLRYRETYWIITLAACLWVFWRAYQVATIRRWRPGGEAVDARGAVAWRPHRIAILLDPGVSLGLVLGVPMVLGSPLSTLRWFVPDLTYWLMLNAVVSVVIAAGRFAVARAPS
jgi:CubicO group peptidase (beta-lactamase class C family)